MMEVTPHLKSVLKNYQHSATKSLQGPGLTLVSAKCEATSPDLKEDCDFLPPTPFPIQQLPILTTADTSCSERTETLLEGESISCFVVGGEKRLCLPQVLNSVLGEFSLMQINQECDQLQIYCSRCTPEQLNVLKNQGILPSSAPSCGLITKTDAERLCSALLHNQVAVTIRPHKGALNFIVYHECFGKCKGLCTPSLCTSKDARCIECLECHGAYTPQQFVCHVHRDLENRTVHWGFDSTLWRSYLYICEDQLDHEQFAKYLDEMRDQFEGKIPFPAPIIDDSLNNLKRKQVHHHGSDILKIELPDIPQKRNKLDEYNSLTYNLNMQQQLHHIYATIDPMYIQYIHEQCLNPSRQMSAFKPFGHVLKDSKIRHAMRYSDPPILQHPEKVIPLSQTERFEGTFQPNVALAPPKKHRYMHVKQEPPDDNKEVVTSTLNCSNSTSVIRHEKYSEQDQNSVQKSPDSHGVIDSTVSVVQSTGNLPRYNSEIELSTDTEDSGSEIIEKSDLHKIEEATKDMDDALRQRILLIVRNMSKEHEIVVQENRNKDNKITELSGRIDELERQIKSLKDLNDSNPLRNGFAEDMHSTVVEVEDKTPSSPVDKSGGGVLVTTSTCENQTSVIEKSEAVANDNGGSSSSSEDVDSADRKTMIIKTAPE